MSSLPGSERWGSEIGRYVLDVTRERLEYPDLRRKVIEVHRPFPWAIPRFAMSRSVIIPIKWSFSPTGRTCKK
jgi:hypothetical protein